MSANPRTIVARQRAAALEPANSLLVHDIRNLSFRLGALLHNLEASYDDPLFKRSVLEILTDTVRKMDGIVRRCRERKDEVVFKIPVDLNQILNRLVERLPGEYLDRGKILVEERYARIPTVWGDEEFLSEALAILIQNALDAMAEKGGRLRLETRVKETRGGKRKIVVTVADTGCGMSADFVKKSLFAPFVTTKNHGLGMGLYASRKIVALHDGTIRVSSREGRGTTFRLFFNAR